MYIYFIYLTANYYGSSVDTSEIVPYRAICAAFALLTRPTKDNILYRKQKFMPLRFTYEAAAEYMLQIGGKCLVYLLVARRLMTPHFGFNKLELKKLTYILEINTVFIYEPTCHTLGNCHLSNKVAH